MRRLIFPAVLLALLWGCSSDEPHQPTPLNRVDIVTLASNDPVARLILDLPGASGRKILMASAPLPGELEEGARLLLDYDAAVADTARVEYPVSVNGFAEILSASVEAANRDEIEAMGAGEVTVISQWLTGQWLNAQLAASYAGEQRSIGVKADESTLEADEVVCYIYNPGDPVGPNSIARRVYASFFIGDLGLRPDQRVKLRVKE